MRLRIGRKQAGFYAAVCVGLGYAAWGSLCGTANVNSPLAEAVDSGDTEQAALLLRNGADPNTLVTRPEEKVRSKFWDEVSYRWDKGESVAAFFDRPQRESVLWLAAKRNHPEIARLLLQHGAAVNLAGNDDDTALIHAAAKGNLELVKMFLAAGASVNQEGKYGNTPLMSAVGSADDIRHTHGEGKYVETVQCLIASGADVNKAMGWGGTLSPLRYAQKYHRDDIAIVLSKAGAK